MEFVIILTMQLGVATLVTIDTGSVWLGVTLLFMMIWQYDQSRRNRAMSVVLQRLYTDARYGKKGVSL